MPPPPQSPRCVGTAGLSNEEIAGTDGASAPPPLADPPLAGSADLPVDLTLDKEEKKPPAVDGSADHPIDLTLDEEEEEPLDVVAALLAINEEENDTEPPAWYDLIPGMDESYSLFLATTHDAPTEEARSAGNKRELAGGGEGTSGSTASKRAKEDKDGGGRKQEDEKGGK